MSPKPRRIVVAGGGPAAIELLLALREIAGDRVALELIAPNRELVVRAYEVLAPFHEGREHRYPLARIASDLGVRVVRDSLAEVDTDETRVMLRSGRSMSYDTLVIAVGARQEGTIGGAIPFRGAKDANRVKALLTDSDSGVHRRVAFVVPAGYTWPLPLYELALHASGWLTERRVDRVPVAIVSPESEPLALFGPAASAEVASLLESHRIEFVSGHPVRLEHGQLLLAGAKSLDCAVAISVTRQRGPRLPGLPCDAHGFVPVDQRWHVPGVERVLAAGDATTFPVKQGGLATQQADAVAAVIAAELGAASEPSEFRPVLRAVLFAGPQTRYLTAELGQRLRETSRASEAPLWPESGKVVGRYLSPYLEQLRTARGQYAPA
jgi:sulfide:quinone oxidoreductase